MKEIEVLVDFEDDKETVLNLLSKYEYIGDKELYDTYYEDPLRDNLKPLSNLRVNELFRVRRIGKECLITYKKHHFEGRKWVYSDEYETKAESYEMIESIIKMLGLEEQIVVNNHRRFYRYEDYEITLDDLQENGLFIEVERLVDDDSVDTNVVKQEIRDFINNMGLTNPREMNIGKNQLVLAKKLGRTDIRLHVDEVKE